jgi:serine/threonine protein kinase
VLDEKLDVPRFITRVRELAERISACTSVASLTIPEAGAIDESQAFVLARYVPGMPAAAYFHTEAAQRPDRLSVIAHLCRLVSDIHRSGIVHGAIKSSNVIVTRGAQGHTPVLLDAGLASAIESSRSGNTPTGHDPARHHDIAALRQLVAELFISHRALQDLQESIVALRNREYDTASDLAEDAAALASRGSQ